MSFNAVPIKLLIDVAKSNGYMEQLPLFLTPPKYTIKEEYLTSVFDGYSCEDNGDGKSTSVTSFTDHPAFSTLRRHLGACGYVDISEHSVNGDRVKEAFYLNDVLFYEGDSFVSASPMQTTLFGKYKKDGPDCEETPQYLPIRTGDYIDEER